MGYAPKPVSIANQFDGMRADWNAAKTGRFRRRRTGIVSTGSGADWHIRSEADYLRVMEYARDMERNDCILGQAVTRAVETTMQNGLMPDPKTGDKELDKDLLARFWDWSSDPRQCDIAGRLTFADQQEIILRRMFVDGDIFAVLTDEGQLQLIEAHRCRTPSNTKRNVVHGVMLDEYRRREEYWFTKDDIDPLTSVSNVSDMNRVPAFDEDGNPLVLHVMHPTRTTQTRGMTAFAPVFDMVGMHDDLQFAKLVQQQIVSCIAFIRERTSDFKYPTNDQQEGAYRDFFDRLVKEMAPGMELRGAPGEKITFSSPNIPNAEFFQQMRFVLQIIGVNLGLPLVMLLMDASDTNFSGWRGAMDQARIGFRRNQGRMTDHFASPTYFWKLRQFIRKDPILRSRAEKLKNKFFNHEWSAPSWPYIQPLQDVQADQLQLKTLLTSPRRLHNQRNSDWEAICNEIPIDNGTFIRKCIAEAQSIEKDTGVKVDWREVGFLVERELITTLPLQDNGNSGQQTNDGSKKPVDEGES